MELEICFAPKEFELPLVCRCHATEWGQAMAAIFDGALLESGTWKRME